MDPIARTVCWLHDYPSASSASPRRPSSACSASSWRDSRFAPSRASRLSHTSQLEYEREISSSRSLSPTRCDGHNSATEIWMLHARYCSTRKHRAAKQLLRRARRAPTTIDDRRRAARTLFLCLFSQVIQVDLACWSSRILNRTIRPESSRFSFARSTIPQEIDDMSNVIQVKSITSP